MTLDNGKKLEIEFFSFIAPRAVANFVKLAKDGFYDGTAFHAISETSCEGGNPLSKLCPNRPRVWKKGSVGYVLPRDEATSVMDTSAGAISLTMDIGGYHGSHFSIHTADNPGTTFAAHTIFARVTKGLDAIQEYVKTDTIDDEQSENPNLPIVPLRITSLVVTGEPTHQTDDSWVPLFIEPEVPEQTDEEKRVEKEAKKKASEGDKEDKKDEEKEPAKSGK